MAATATKTKGNDSVVSNLMDSMVVEDQITIPLRGRGFDSDVLAIRSELEKCQTEGTARSFQNVSEDDRETYARKVRAAGAIEPAIKVGTRYDKAKSKLIWGPSDVLKSLASKSPKS